MPAIPVTTKFCWVRVVGDRVLVSGHGPEQQGGTPSGPFSRVPDAVSFEQAQQSARLAALAVIAGVEQAVGDLDRIDAWLTVTGYVQAEPGHPQTTAVLNSFSAVVLDVFGPSIGQHARDRHRRGRVAAEPSRRRRCRVACRRRLTGPQRMRWVHPVLPGHSRAVNAAR